MAFINNAIPALLKDYQPSLPIHTPRFRIKEEHLTFVADEINCELSEVGSSWSSRGTIDHPSFTRLREHLGEKGLIEIERRWTNGDRVLAQFYLNDVLFEADDKFPCAPAMKYTLERGEKHPMKKLQPPQYDAELHNYNILPAYAGGLVATGEIYNDSKGRFADGELIRTSLVKNVEDGILITRNTRYKLV